MRSVVKIIKRGEREQKNLGNGPNEGTGQQARREIVSTVKSWIVELEQRRRAEERTYALLRK
jgi:hypothetical protein